jgi:hypothetical protein
MPPLPPMRPSRRDFLRLCGALAGGLVTAGAAAADPGRGGEKKGRGPKGFRIYRRSVRGRRASNALKLDAANKRFLTRTDALRHRLYRGDNARVVAIEVGLDEVFRLFLSRRRGRFFLSRVVDLRSL